MIYLGVCMLISFFVTTFYFFNKMHLNMLNTLKACNEITAKEIALLHDLLRSLENNVGKKIEKLQGNIDYVELHVIEHDKKIKRIDK